MTHVDRLFRQLPKQQKYFEKNTVPILKWNGQIILCNMPQGQLHGCNSCLSDKIIQILFCCHCTQFVVKSIKKSLPWSRGFIRAVLKYNKIIQFRGVQFLRFYEKYHCVHMKRKIRCLWLLLKTSISLTCKIQWVSVSTKTTKIGLQNWKQLELQCPSPIS